MHQWQKTVLDSSPTSPISRPTYSDWCFLPMITGPWRDRMAGRFFDNCGGATACTNSHHEQTSLKIILAQNILSHLLSHSIACSHPAAAEWSGFLLLVLIQCKSCRLTAAVNHNVSPLRYELTTKPAGLLCTAVQLLIARKIRRSLPFTKQADVAMDTVKYFKASANKRPWVWLAWRTDRGGNRPETKTPCFQCSSVWYWPYAVEELSILYYKAYKRYSITVFKNVFQHIS